MSNLSKKSLKSVLGGSRSGSRNTRTRQVMSPPVTSETNLETSLDEEVFLAAGGEKGRVTNIVDQLQGQLVRRGSSAASDWRDPRKGRRVGSPGRTGKAEYFIRQDQLPSVPIELEDRARTEFVSRQRPADRRSVASAPHPVGGARPRTSQHLKPPSQRRRERTQKYAGYSESDFTSDDEARKQEACRRLELPGQVSPLSSSSCGDVSVTPPPPASPDTSPLQQYSLISFTQSDMELVQSSVPQ